MSQTLYRLEKDTLRYLTILVARISTKKISAKQCKTVTYSSWCRIWRPPIHAYHLLGRPASRLVLLKTICGQNRAIRITLKGTAMFVSPREPTRTNENQRDDDVTQPWGMRVVALIVLLDFATWFYNHKIILVPSFRVGVLSENVCHPPRLEVWDLGVESQ